MWKIHAWIPHESSVGKHFCELLRRVAHEGMMNVVFCSGHSNYSDLLQIFFSKFHLLHFVAGFHRFLQIVLNFLPNMAVIGSYRKPWKCVSRLMKSLNYFWGCFLVLRQSCECHLLHWTSDVALLEDLWLSEIGQFHCYRLHLAYKRRMPKHRNWFAVVMNTRYKANSQPFIIVTWWWIFLRLLVTHHRRKTKTFFSK